MNSVDARIAALREQMKAWNVDIYYVPTSDFHETEYVSDYFKCREYITGFTGSAGVAVITATEAGLWTDGRYFIQADHQLSGSEVKLFREGVEGVPTVFEYISSVAFDGARIGFDGRVVNVKFVNKLREELKDKNVTLVTDRDLIGDIWADRPSLPANKVWSFDKKYTGCDTDEKLRLIRSDMAKLGADVHIISVLDNINWLFNIRGGDILHYPVVLSYAVIMKDRAVLFVNQNTIDSSVRETLNSSGIEIMDYDGVYDFVAKLDASHTFLLDTNKVNYLLYSKIDCGAAIIDAPNPCVIRQACKNSTEVENIKRAHVRDGVAMTKFIFWLKKNIGKIPMTEISASDYLEELRREQGIFDLSFDTISAYGANAAMMHYSATPESFANLKPEGFLLVDSGGHYLEGSTDITRTIVLGPVSDEMKKMYTLVLKGNMALANARFLYGCRGLNLDILARGPLWDLGLDYRCGTGHGVGYCLNIHEAPNGFRWRVVPERNDSAVLEEGMITSDEPGYYEEDGYGIRIENEMVCKKGVKTEYGQFMEFETITYVPIDLEAVDKRYLTFTDIERINNYHKMVYDVISPYLEGEELEFLKKATREIR
ncbi:MAG: aminopeptidase P family protein [Lachnospiraceae bacterium]|nr:aminopeptidase P family protein [Lachnospiraceae bacterium]